MDPAQRTRRELLLVALAGGVAGAAALGPVPALAQAQDDSALLSTLLGTELLASFVYAHALHSGVLSPEARRLVRHLLGHEHAHAKQWADTLTGIGGALPTAPETVTDADKLLAAASIPITLEQLRSEGDWLRLLLRLEIVLERSYYNAMGKLEDPELQKIAAQVLAAEAQHATAIAELLFPGDVDKAVPESFVEGNPGDARV